MKIRPFLTFTILTVLVLYISADVIKISSFGELCLIGKHTDFPLDGNYELTGNIDASSSRNMNDGKGFNPIGRDINPSIAFTGTFDGKGFVINDLYINRLGEIPFDCIGLFARMSNGGEIKNVGLVNVFVFGDYNVGALVGCLGTGKIIDCYSTGNVSGTEGYVAGSLSTGGLVGTVTGSSTITASYFIGTVSGTAYNNIGGLVGSFDPSSSNTMSTMADCYFAGNVSGTDAIVGGLVGYSNGATITNCYSTGNVYGACDNVYLNCNVGGLVGYMNRGHITNSYSTALVNGTGDCTIGGLIGFWDGGANTTITNCYSTGSVSGTGYYIGGLIGAVTGNGIAINCYSTGAVSGTGDNIGGLIGYYSYDSKGTVSNCFWDIETSGLTISAVGQGRTTSQMRQQITYAGWDFDDIWQIEEDQSYPYLLSLGKPTSVIGNKITRNTAIASVPLITVKGKTLNIKSSPTSDLQIRLFDMRGKTLARFNTRGSNSFSLSKIPAGRYLVETKENGKRVGTAAVVLR